MDSFFDPPDGVVRHLIAASQDHGMGPFQSDDGLSQQSRRQDPAVAEWQRRIDGDDIQIPRQASMLEAVVHDQYLRPVAADRLGGAGHPVRIDDDGNVPALVRQKGRLVRERALLCLVAASQDGAGKLLGPYVSTQPRDKRRLACSPGREVTHADDDGIRTVGSEDLPVVQRIADIHGQAVTERSPAQQGPRAPSPHVGAPA